MIAGIEKGDLLLETKFLKWARRSHGLSLSWGINVSFLNFQLTAL